MAQIILALLRREVLPVVVSRQVKTVGATRNFQAAAQGVEHFAVEQALAGFTRLGMQAGIALVELVDDFGQHVLGDVRVVMQAIENVFLSL